MADMFEKILGIVVAVVGLQIISESVATALLNLTGIAATVAGFITVIFALGILRVAGKLK
ncbi:MAG: hypothetical protein ACOC2M_00560 [bacterium]